MSRPLLSLAVLFAIAIAAAAALLYVADRREAQRAVENPAVAVGDQPAIIIQENADETTVAETGPGEGSDLDGEASEEQQLASAPSEGDIAAPSDAATATAPGELPATTAAPSDEPAEQTAGAAAPSEEPDEQTVTAAESPAAGAETLAAEEEAAEAATPSMESGEQIIAGAESSTATEESAAPEIEESPSAAPGSVPTVEEQATAEPGGVEPDTAPDAAAAGARPSATIQPVAPQNTDPQTLAGAAELDEPAPGAAATEEDAAANDRSEPIVAPDSAAAGATEEGESAAAEQSEPANQSGASATAGQQGAAEPPSLAAPQAESDQNVAAAPSSSSTTLIGPDAAASTSADVAASTASEGEEATDSERAIAAVEQQATPAEEPAAAPSSGAPLAGPISPDAAPEPAMAGEQQALEYPAPPPNLESSATASAEPAAPPAADAGPVEMPRSGEMVAAAPSGDAAVAEADDITPGPSVGVTQSEGDARSLAERASGNVEARDLSIRAAEAEADNLYVAGEAAPGTLVHVYANEELVGDARAGAEGTWLVEAETDVPIGEVVIRADAVAAGAVAPSAQAEAPFMRFPDGVVLEPLGTAISESGELTASGYVPVPTYVLIRRGDNLWRIARRNYGRGVRYQAIFEANNDRIRDPDLIFPGQVFIIPKRDVRWETASH